MGDSSAKQVTVEGVECIPYELDGEIVLDLRPVGFLDESTVHELLRKKHNISKLFVSCDDVFKFVGLTLGRNFSSEITNMTTEFFTPTDKTNPSAQEFGGKYLWRTGEIKIDKDGDIFVNFNCMAVKGRELRFWPGKKIKELSLTGLRECLELEKLSIVCSPGSCLKQPVNFPPSANLKVIELVDCGLKQFPAGIHRRDRVEDLDLRYNKRLGDHAVNLGGFVKLKLLGVDGLWS